MSNPERRSPAAAPDSATSKQAAEFASVGELVGELVTEARTRAEADRLDARTRAPVTRLLLLITLLAVVATGATTIYGIWNFADAPIRAIGSGYAGKNGTERTQRDYENYVAWSRAMWIAYPATILVAFAFVWADNRDRRAKATSNRF
jgi:hypothetical protein